MEKNTKMLLHKKIDEILKISLKNIVFTGCSIGFLVKSGNGFCRTIYNYGSSGDDNNAFAVSEKSVFDLASLTKPLVTSLSLLPLLQDGEISLNDSIHKFFGARSIGKENITLFHLLTHSSGLPAHHPYYRELIEFPENVRKERLIDLILRENICYEPGSENIYSDLGFMLLGHIIEIVSGESLDNYWHRTIIKPLGLENGLFFANKKEIGSKVYVDTGKCGWSKTRLYGKVNDDNCRAIGGVAGHAGLFGTSQAVISLCENILLQYKGVRKHPAYSGDTLRKVLSRKHGTWEFGFDTPSPGQSSSGKYFSDKSIGHLGFTGTSFWIDLEKEIVIVFLSNRVFCGDQLQAIKKLRPLLHDTIMELIYPIKELSWKTEKS